MSARRSPAGGAALGAVRAAGNSDELTAMRVVNSSENASRTRR